MSGSSSTGQPTTTHQSMAADEPVNHPLPRQAKPPRCFGNSTPRDTTLLHLHTFTLALHHCYAKERGMPWA